MKFIIISIASYGLSVAGKNPEHNKINDVISCVLQLNTAAKNSVFFGFLRLTKNIMLLLYWISGKH